MVCSNVSSYRCSIHRLPVLDSSTGQPARGVEIRLQEYHPATIDGDLECFKHLAIGCVKLAKSSPTTSSGHQKELEGPFMDSIRCSERPVTTLSVRRTPMDDA